METHTVKKWYEKFEGPLANATSYCSFKGLTWEPTSPKKWFKDFLKIHFANTADPKAFWPRWEAHTLKKVVLVTGSGLVE